MAATLVPTGPRSKKKSGTPMSAPLPKQTSCLLVKIERDLGFDFRQVFGYGYISHLETSLPV